MDKIRDKRAFRQSPSTVLRERPPTSPDVAERGQPKMVLDFSQQKEVVPKSLGQTTRYGENDGNFRTMNAGGKPFALDVMMGGGGDPRGRGFGPSTQHLTPKKGR
jgi:hypothetical protein